ncbi:hypothetical protein M3Y99_01623300 [Aphelenchoides fujianensis]|nr:hypothetical protein M3Y99_01623300 [Aphelenchoides fujianensis]
MPAAFDPENPYVQDVLFFANVTNATYAGSPIAIIRLVNNLAAFTIGSFAIGLLVYLVLFKTSAQFAPYSRLLLLSAVVDTIHLFSYFWCQQRYRVESNVMVATFVGPAQFLPHAGMCVSMIFQNSSPQLTVTIVPVMFYYRFYSLRHSRPPSGLRTLFVVAVPVLLVAVDCAMGIPAFCSPADVGGAFERYYWPEVPVPKLLVGNMNKNFFAQATLLYHRVLTFGSYIPAIFFAFLSVRELQKQSLQLSTRTKKLQRAFNWMLFAQALVPFVTLVCPIIGFTALAWGNVSFRYSSEFNVLLLTWAPPLSALSSILLIKPFRQHFVHLLSCGLNGGKRVGASTNSLVDSRALSVNPSTRVSSLPPK